MKIKQYCLVLVCGLSLAACGSQSPTDANAVLNDATNTKTPPDDGSCLDLYGQNSSWSDNCVLKRGGLYADSSYTLGAQRLLWCTGYSADTAINALTEAAFATGIFDLATEQAVKRYQVAQALDDHGAVGPATWQSLQNQLKLVGANAAEYSSYAVSEGSCQDEILFYQRNTSPQDWKMAVTRGSADLTDFSVEPR